jgi:hypothetical protein
LITILIIGIFYMYFIKGNAANVGKTSASYLYPNHEDIIRFGYPNIKYLPIDPKYN